MCGWETIQLYFVQWTFPALIILHTQKSLLELYPFIGANFINYGYGVM